MTDLFLIAHKVHGLPAFDVAIQMECPCCAGVHGFEFRGECHECDSLGYWWIIPTSGHRAYPYWNIELVYLGDRDETVSYPAIIASMPPSLPDHYPTHTTPTISLAEALGIRPKPTPSAPIVRRF